MYVAGSWRAVLIVTLLLLVIAGFASLFIKRPEHFPRMRVRYHPRPDERDSVAFFRRIMDAQRARLGI